MANKTPPWSNVAKTKEEVYNILKTTKGNINNIIMLKLMKLILI